MDKRKKKKTKAEAGHKIINVYKAATADGTLLLKIFRDETRGKYSYQF